MFSPQITAILKRQLFFLGTICEGTPRVRPMRPFVDAEDNIWLISYKGTEKNKEIELNNKVELCTVDNNDVLRHIFSCVRQSLQPIPALEKLQKIHAPNNLMRQSGFCVI